MIDLKNLTIVEAHDALVKKEFTAIDLAKAYLAVIEEKNKDINAYIEVYDDVITQAETAQKMIDEGEASMLTGIPLAIKDNILIKGKKASSASNILKNYTATYDAFVIEKLKKEGAVFLGRVNMDDSAMGGSTETSCYGPTRNPYDLSRVPGGSSGGPAAAVAMDGALASIGSDTGGSVRQPASLCGLVGLKPTYGAVSRSGLMALASSLDQIGPFGKTVEDTKILFNALCGKDVKDSTSLEYIPRPVKTGKMVLGVPRSFITKGIDPDVAANFEESLEKLKKAGYEIRDIEMPYMHYSLPAYYIILPAEASANLARYDGVKYGLHVDGKNLLEDYMLTKGQGYGKEVRRRLILGTYVLSSGYYDAYYNKAVKVQALVAKDFENAFKDVDAVLTPTSPCPAFKIGERMNDPLSMYLSDIFTVSVNLAGVPGISVPCGMATREGKELPLGLQIIAPHFGEETLFKIGADFEKVR